MIIDGRPIKEAYEKRTAKLEKIYGVSNPRQIQGVTEKIKKTCEKRYGGIGGGSKEILEKMKKTNKEKFGVCNAMQNKDIAKKVGVQVTKEANPERAKKISNSLKGKTSHLKGKTYEDIYGIDRSIKIKELKRQYHINRFLEYEFPKLLDYFDFEFIDEKYKGAHVFHNFKCKKCGLIINKQWNSIQQGFRCTNCYPRFDGTSKGEKELLNFIKNILPSDIEIIENTKIIIPPKELDIYIPSLNIAFEYNGIYYHSEASKWFSDPKYHLNKTNNCDKKGIRLIHIFEDEWIYKKDIVKERLKQILNVGIKIRIHGRKCIIKEITSNIKNQFLDDYHIQGKDASSIKLGAFYKDELISVMTFSKGNISKGLKSIENVWELNRFCSAKNVVGIAGKLLKYFQRNYKWKSIFSYADRRWSSGNLYYKLGFKLAHITKINYWYILGYKRIHRFNLRKTKNDPSNIPEYILRKHQGYTRIWDCGSLKFSLINKED